jgi:hypothetical protein
VRAGGGTDDPGAQTPHCRWPPSTCGQARGSIARSPSSGAQRGAGDRPIRPAKAKRHCATTAGVAHASACTCTASTHSGCRSTRFQCAATDWLVQQARSWAASATSYLRSAGAADSGSSAWHACGTADCGLSASFYRTRSSHAESTAASGLPPGSYSA